MGMFAKRRSSQKPDEHLYAAFKRDFPDVGPGTTSAGSGPPVSGPLMGRSASMEEAIIDEPSSNRYELHIQSSPTLSCPSVSELLCDKPAIMDHDLGWIKQDSPLTTSLLDRQFDSIEDGSKDQDDTPKPFNDQWRLTPSLMDPTSFAFSAFANQPPGYYTPTPGGFNTFYHSSAAGDLHTPGMGMNTPLSMPASMHALHAPDPNMHYPHFNPQMLPHGQQYHDAFQHQQAHQQSYAPPSHFLQHQDSGYAAMDDSPHKVTPNGGDIHTMPPSMAQVMPQLDLLSGPVLPSGEKYVIDRVSEMIADHSARFRFHTTLNAPTAMVRNNDEIPITYLNKGQAYTMSIFDTAPPNPHPGVPFKYRTYVRISFEDEQQRAKPESCWQLWKEGRGSNEAHQRGGKLLAVEYVDPNQGGDEELRKSQIEVEKASFDGFAVTWYPSHRAPGAPDCSISVRFNFLSTDFSHSKGVKGIPVRLCAKTELLTTVPGQVVNDPEVCFSKVKLFRDHGAERKLSNDVAHVKKSIDKLKQQISQAESGMGSVGKRKRSGSMAKGGMQTHQIFHLGLSTNSNAEAAKLSAEEDLHVKLMNLQDMFSSTRPVSVLFLRGENEDDPDACPVKLLGGEEIKVLSRAATLESRQSSSASPSSNVSPTPTSTSLTPKRKHSEIQQSSIAEEVEHETGSEKDRSVSPERPVKILKQEHDASKTDILAVDIDESYNPPAIEPQKKPGKSDKRLSFSFLLTASVACFYVKQKDADHHYYRAIYLRERTVRDLIKRIAEKFDIESHRITRVFHITPRGFQIIVDEEVVRELPEGQGIIVEFAPARFNHDIKPEFNSASTTKTVVNVDDLSSEMLIPDALEMWLNY